MPFLVNVALVVFTIVTTLAALAFTLGQWRRRGGLRVMFFQDRLSKNVAAVAFAACALLWLAVVGIQVFLLATGSSAALAAGAGLLILAPLVVSLSVVEGRYGNGFYVQLGTTRVLSDSLRFDVDHDRVTFHHEGAVHDRYFWASTANTARIAAQAGAR